MTILVLIVLVSPSWRSPAGYTRGASQPEQLSCRPGEDLLLVALAQSCLSDRLQPQRIQVLRFTHAPPRRGPIGPEHYAAGADRLNRASQMRGRGGDRIEI